jgi:hypothetical protein
MRWIILVAWMAVAGAAQAQPSDDILATRTLLGGCQSLVENDPNGTPLLIGACAGAASSALTIAQDVRRACPPAGTGVLDVARLVIAFAQERPARQSQPFGSLALTAMSDRWPC